MAQTIRLKRSSTVNDVPTISQLALGELAINTHDGKIFLKKDDGTESIIEVGSGYEIETVNGNTTLEAGKIYPCDTHGATLGKDQTAFTLTLPASPDDGDVLLIMDGYGNAQNRPILVDRNGNDIDSKSENIVLDVNYFDIKLIYSNTNSTWALGGK
jgi:hypothetical protein